MTPTFTLLIVDDDEDDKEKFIEIVNEMHSSVTCITATSGTEALQLLQKENIRPDFVFLDLNMPRMNGKQCLSQLKKDPNFESIPVIVYTTSALNEDVEETRQLVAAHFITKRTKVDRLKKELSYVFEKNQEMKQAF